MERAVAVKKLAKMLGKNFSYEIDSKAPTPEERATAKIEMPAVLDEMNRLEKMMNDRRRVLLDADSEYQTIIAKLKSVRNRKAELNGHLYSHKFTVGHVDRAGGFGFFHVKAQGDSWEEIFDKLAAEKR